MSFFVFASIPTFTQVKHIGALKNVMWKGELFGTIHLDTIQNKNHLYGIGPLENLSGELMIFDGVSYKATVDGDDMKVEESFDVRAPFFVYSNVSEWIELKWKKNIDNQHALEKYLVAKTKNKTQPFTFKLSGVISYAKIHLMNLPAGTKVNSPEDAHQHRVYYELENIEVDIIGYFSTMHQQIFTHKDSFIHMHLITKDRKKMGHIDEIKFGKEKINLCVEK